MEQLTSPRKYPLPRQVSARVAQGASTVEGKRLGGTSETYKHFKQTNMEKEIIKTLQESDGIAIGDYVRLKDSGSVGMVCSILDYGTHIAFFLDLGRWIKFPAKREWIEPLQPSEQK